MNSMVKFLVENWGFIYAMFTWWMGYNLGYRHGRGR